MKLAFDTISVKPLAYKDSEVWAPHQNLMLPIDLQGYSTKQPWETLIGHLWLSIFLNSDFKILNHTTYS